MISSGLDEKEVSFKTNVQAAIITWGIASYFLLKEIKRACSLD
jgi:hypothetical protein